MGKGNGNSPQRLGLGRFRMEHPMKALTWNGKNILGGYSGGQAEYLRVPLIDGRGADACTKP
jgi:hypothetical protein